MNKVIVTKFSGETRRRYKVLADHEINALSWEWDNEKKEYSSIAFDVNIKPSERLSVRLSREALEYLLTRLNERRN